ncbi:MAG: response regulator [Deltaproteobacteria bacterium]|nr:response regulator [Deltaproteobacteria bacterium]
MPIRVLLVEDDEEDYLLTRKLLKDNPETTFEVTWARTYEAAIEELEKPYQAVLVDYRLGAHSGLDLIATAVADGFAAPMILLTGNGDYNVDKLAMKLGASDYLVKDQITPQLMERVIRHSIERKAARAEQKGSELALSKSEQQYRQIVEETSDGIVKVDLDLKIVFVNRRFTEMLGYEPSEMVGASIFAFMSAAAKLSATRSYEQLSQGQKVAADGSFRHRSGSDIWCNIAGTPLLDADGRHIGNLGVVRDETERRKLQSQLMVSDRMASVGTLAAGVAHEINNPLAAVIANLDFVADAVTQLLDDPRNIPSQALRAELKEPLDDALEGAHRVRLIVRDLKLFSRSPIEDPKTPVDVDAIMESSLRMAWNEIRHRAKLIKCYGCRVGVHVNEARLGQVFLNLLINAAQAIPEGRAAHNEIRVATRVEGDHVLIDVSDTGAGMPPEVVDRIFDAFFTTKAIGVGTGLGLAISQRLVADMRGDISVESEAGKGTTFRVRIPVTSEAGLERVAPVVKAPPLARRGRVLIVDDETLIVRGMLRILGKQHDVVAVNAAKEALAMCVANVKFDVILCDLMMPEMTGMELHAELTRVAPDQADRMIFVTGGAFTSVARQFLSDSLKEHLEKPFDPRNLRAIVQRYLR